MRIDLVLCLPRESLTLPVIRHIVRCALQELGVTSDSIDDVALALSEACTNVIEHSGVDDEYEVQLTIGDSVCDIKVVDTGRGFDSASLPTGMAAGTEEQGRGLALMAALVDAIQFESRPSAGTVVHLVKHLEMDGDGPLGSLLARQADNPDGADGQRPDSP